MAEAEIRFDEGREGLIPVGSYLIDAARRFGAIADANCFELDEHICKFQIQQGDEVLSEVGGDESALLTEEERKRNYRLGCFTRIEKPGVIVAMAEKKKESKETTEQETDNRDETYRKEFAELPLEKKISNLVHLEAMALSETFAFVINSPFKIFEKVGDVLAEFGFKKEEQEKQRSRPAEGKTNGSKGSKKSKTEEGDNEIKEPPST